MSDRLGVEVSADPSPVTGLAVTDLVGLAMRRNPRRAHLLVSTVLGKHLPTDPRVVYGAGRLLGALVADHVDGGDSGIGDKGGALLKAALTEPAAASELLRLLDDRARRPERTVVFGYAETATALGHCVAESLGAPYLHSTRRAVPGFTPLAGFEEEHSHATSHLLLPEDPELLDRAETLVIVDDELSTGRTVLNTIASLTTPCVRYVVAALIDVRDDEARAAMAAFAEQAGITIDVVCLAAGAVVLPDGILDAAARLLDEQAPAPAPAPAPAGPASAAATVAEPRVISIDWAADQPDGGRHGITAADTGRLKTQAAGLAYAVALALEPTTKRVLVLGTEEFLYLPLLVAEALTARLPGKKVTFSSSTRSPVLAVDEPGYAIRSAEVYACQGEPRFAYNTGGFWGEIVVITDVGAPEDGLVEVLAGAGRRVTHLCLTAGLHPDLAPLRGPGFGSYPADEVGWLLTDLSGVTLEAPAEEREEAIQAGTAHYAESLPQEYQPSSDYQRLFQAALQASVDRLAHAVGVVTELVLAERGRDAVLVSLARAGTPVGLLMRRWARRFHSAETPHYAVSIVRGRGIDTLAMRWLAARHDPADVVFVDGWTGKGAIASELTATIKDLNHYLGTSFNPDLAVLADPGHCVTTFGTREDYLIPSACLNSTVSGLVSRTVLNQKLLRSWQFHGAKFYAELAEADVSMAFVDVVSAAFDAVRDRVAQDWPGLAQADRTPTWSGQQLVAGLGELYGIEDVNLIKPGVGETTRVLLRRVPWKVLADPGAGADIAHIRLLAAQRGVPVEEVEGLGYKAVGLILPSSKAEQ